jgi:tetratricopeptide (TPR) repeat protein
MKRLVCAIAAVALTVGACGRSSPPQSSSSSSAPAIASTTSGRHVIFVGLDGADWALLDQYIAHGTMPSLARLVKEGTTGTLTTIHPALSPLVWTTMLTGVSPLDHRVLDFLRVNPVSQKREPITSDERKAPAIWNMATAGGKRAAALGFWATYPAEAINGLVVSDRLFTFLYGESQPPPGIVFPTALDGWARDALRRVEHDTDFSDLKRFVPSLSEAEYREAMQTTDPYAHPVSALRRILVETRVYDALGRDYFAREKPDVMTIYVQGTDSIGHVFAPYAPPRQAAITESDYARYSGVPERYFAEIDRMLGEYRTLAEQTGSVLMLASDHGFAWSEGRPTELSSVANATAAKWHTDNGIYLLWGSGIAASAPHEHHGSVQQVCATLLALLGLPPGKDLFGPPLPGATASNAAAFDYRAHYTPAATAATTAGGDTRKVDDDTVAKLKALGYIGASEGSGRAIGTRTAGSFNNEGLILKQQGRKKEAIDAFDNALAVDPNLASAAWNLSDLLFAENQSLDKSDALLVRAFAHGLPEGTKFLIGRAIGYQRNGMIDRSIRLLDQAAAARPDEPEVWAFRGRYRVEKGDCDGAIGDFQRAAQLTPQSAAVFASLGLAQACAGRDAASRASFQRSLQLDPNQPKVREYLRRGKP